ncbi:hypothetical protein LSH36_128g01014 [Paralvinella palmiformis]|uniref:Uncharacterized protein n=1 Tax=Paralvinella palmiformis TaxID=53620 RepID=A0AAD9JWQ0_9ANNE|nr:hypothetical protein LSH36_128g01014 [Paralvinella palmiformis]
MLDRLTRELVMKDCGNKPTVQADGSTNQRNSIRQPWQLPPQKMKQQPQSTIPNRQEYLQRCAPPGTYDLVQNNSMPDTSSHHQSRLANDWRSLSSTVDIVVESMSANIVLHINAHTTSRVTGNMKVMNWNEHKQQWPHLKEIQFLQIGPRPTVDIFIAVDQADPHCSLCDIRGEPGEPIA